MTKSEATKNDVLQLHDIVFITRRFFLNHGLEIRDLGYATIIYMDKSKSAVTLQMKFFDVLKQYHDEGYLKLINAVELKIKKPEKAFIEIHSVYLQKFVPAKEKKRGKENSETQRKHHPRVTTKIV